MRSFSFSCLPSYISIESSISLNQSFHPSGGLSDCSLRRSVLLHLFSRPHQSPTSLSHTSIFLKSGRKSTPSHYFPMSFSTISLLLDPPLLPLPSRSRSLDHSFGIRLAKSWAPLSTFVNVFVPRNAASLVHQTDNDASSCRSTSTSLHPLRIRSPLTFPQIDHSTLSSSSTIRPSPQTPTP